MEKDLKPAMLQVVKAAMDHPRMSDCNPGVTAEALCEAWYQKTRHGEDLVEALWELSNRL